jgi:hypothetical protein
MVEVLAVGWVEGKARELACELGYELVGKLVVV